MLADQSKPSAIRTSQHWVLVVDDEAPVRQLLTDVFNSLGFEVLTACEGNAALHQIDVRATEPLLVLADVIMPGMDGLTLARKLQVRLKHSKIVIMSGQLDDSSWWPTDLRELAFLPKPIDLPALQRLVNEAVLFYPGAK